MNLWPIVLRDRCETWPQDVMEHHHEEAQTRVAEVLARAVEDHNGCKVTATLGRPKVRFRGRQVAAARLVYCVTRGAILPETVVVRHRCHNPRCGNPDHLDEGTAAENKRGDQDHWANGVDYRLL